MNGNEWDDMLFLLQPIKDDIARMEQIEIAILCIAIILTIMGIAILWNQHKIKKMLKQIQEQKEDKP